MYKKYIKRLLDIILSLVAITVFLWLYIFNCGSCTDFFGESGFF